LPSRDRGKRVLITTATASILNLIQQSSLVLGLFAIEHAINLRGIDQADHTVFDQLYHMLVPHIAL
jgi:hypothetical protein